MIHDPTLLNSGYLILDYPLDLQVRDLVIQKNWKKLDQYFLSQTAEGGSLREFLKNYLNFEHLEHIVAIRIAPDDEDGIWHDDGSRNLGFSLSLNLNPSSIKGGELLIRKKNNHTFDQIAPLPIGKIVIFLTGTKDYEHKVCAVQKGERIVIAGWCT